jgi:two-component system chemotaxis response regulator CheY
VPWASLRGPDWHAAKRRLARLLLLQLLNLSKMQSAHPAAEFLLVDNDPSVSEFLATYLSERGHPSKSTVQVDKALDWVSENRCEVVVVDLNLPNANGTSLIASLRAIDARLPIVVFTEKGCNEAQMRAAMRAGASGYVSKNLPMEQLYCVLARVLATARYNARRVRLQRELLGAA